VAICRPDRTYRMPLQRSGWRLALVDMFTGICLGWQDIEASDLDGPLSWDGSASRLDVSLMSATPDLDFNCTVQYVPDDEHWPVNARAQMRGDSHRNGMTLKATTGEKHSLYLPARSGRLKVALGKLATEFRVPSRATKKIVVDIDKEGPRLRKQ